MQGDMVARQAGTEECNVAFIVLFHYSLAWCYKNGQETILILYQITDSVKQLQSVHASENPFSTDFGWQSMAIFLIYF